MQLGQYYKIREGVQRNARPADHTARTRMMEVLSESLAGSGLFHSVEVGQTDHRDRLVIAMCGFVPDRDLNDVSGRLVTMWNDRIGYPFWSSHVLLTDGGQVEFQGATRISSQGHYVTVHLIAQRSEAPAPAPAVEPAVAPVLTPAPRRRRLFARPLWGPALAPA